MTIPKYILHPTLLLLGMGTLFWLTATPMPTNHEVRKLALAVNEISSDEKTITHSNKWYTVPSLRKIIK